MCTVQSFEDRLISMWYWLPNATWAHTVEFRGKTVNVWLFMVKQKQKSIILMLSVICHCLNLESLVAIMC